MIALNHYRPVIGKFLITFLAGLFMSQVGFGQTVVSGRVVDEASGEAIPGVNILEKGTLNGTITNEEGHYEIEVSDPGATLVFSFIGYELVEIGVDSRSTINVSLSSGLELEEVLVVGFGTQKKESVVGAVSQIEGDVLVSSGTNNVSTAIAGKLSGVVALQSEGKPGEEEPKIFIRGAATWNSTDPLILVDGIERSSWSDIDPNEIASVSVLKDASATAVYGAKGGNGVILITTKRGISGKPVFNFTYGYGIKQVSDEMTMMDAYQTMIGYNIALKNDNLWDQLVSREMLEHYRRQDEPIRYPSVNWIDELFKTGQTTHTNLSVRGGTPALDYFVSLGYLYDGDILNLEKQGDFDPRNFYNRYNYRTNLDYKLSGSTTLSLNVSGSVQARNRPSEMNRGAHSRVWEGIYTSAVNASPLYYPASVLEEYPDPKEPDAKGIRYPFFNNGQLHDNPYSMLNTVGFENQDQYILNTDFVFNQDLSMLTEGLSFNASFSYGSNNEYHRIYGEGSGNQIAPRYRLTVYDDGSYLWQRRPDYHEDLPQFIFDAESQRIARQSLYYDMRFDYERRFGNDHYVTALAVFRRKQESIGTQEPFKEEAWSGRATYAYKLKYLLETNLGYNGSESFAPGNRFGFFPAFAIGWNIAEEQFVRDRIPFLDRFKIRYSYGEVGVDNVGRWLYYQSYYESRLADRMIVTGNGLGAFGAWYSTNSSYFEGPVANEQAQWETAIKQNLGIEIGIFDEISFSLDLFKEDRDNILQTPNTVPEMASIEFKELNLGRTKSHGFEIEVSYDKRLGRDLDISLNGKYSFSENRVLFRDDPEGLPAHQKEEGFPIGLPRTQLSAGRYSSVDDINNYVQPGTNSTAIGEIGYPSLFFYGIGDEMYVDYNGDGIIDSNDAVADLYPSYPGSHFAFTARIGWRGFSIRTLVTGQMGKTSTIEDEFVLPYTNTFPLLYGHETDYYTRDNRDSFFPAPHTGVFGQYNYLNPVYSKPVSSFVRMKELEISYSLDAVELLHVDDLVIFINAHNLLTYAPNTHFGDPEKSLLRPGADGSYPLLRRYNIGVKLRFQ